MKKYIGICIAGLMLFLSACYDDKGNYSYSDINEMTLTMTPASEGGSENIYILTQSQDDSLLFTLTPEVKQTLERKDGNLSYTWIRQWYHNQKNYQDTLHTKSCTFAFPPKTAMSYSVMFILRDETNGQEIYRQLTVKTVVPYIRSWLVMHGNDGDRRIGALEYDATRINVQRMVTDIYEELRGKRRFNNAFAMKYASMYSSNIEKGDKLFVFQPDSVTWIYPFGCTEQASTLRMMPGSWNARFMSCISNLNGKFGLLGDNGKYYHNGAFGYFYQAQADEGATDYHADRAYISADAYVTLWDDVHKNLLYYGNDNWYDNWNDNRADVTSFDSRIVYFTPEDLKEFDLSDCRVLWIGKGLTDQAETGASVLLKANTSGTCYMLNIGYGGKDKAFSLYKDDGGEPTFIDTENIVLRNVDFDERTVFASTGAFRNQLFYAQGSDLYLYNIISGESDFLYSAGSGKTITRLAFRQEERGSMDTDVYYERMLGIAVQTAQGQGEFHELVLDEAGDVSQSSSFDGFGPIVDFCYSYMSHASYDL